MPAGSTSPHGAEADSDRRARGDRPREQCAHEHHVHGRGRDDGGDSCAELHAEAEAVDPTSVLLQPAFVDLTRDGRDPQSADPGIEEGRDQRKHGDRRDRRRGRVGDDRGAQGTARAPMVTPPRTEPATKNIAATPNRLFRPRSPSGVMLESIDSPHGDQVDRTAPTTADATPAHTTTAVTVRGPDTSWDRPARCPRRAGRRRRCGARCGRRSPATSSSARVPTSPPFPRRQPRHRVRRRG